MQQPAGTHLAQLNIGRIVAPIDDPRMAGFANNLDRINALAERSEGFVWRLTGAGNDATDITWTDDPLLIPNLSVWTTVDALSTFVFHTIHKQFYGRRAAWFAPMDRPHFVMWWVPAGHLPTLDDALDRLDALTRDGDGPSAFGWSAVGDPRLEEELCA